MKFYKIASVFALSIFAFALFSCENEPLEGFDLENGENPFTSNNLVGTWTLSSLNLSVNSSTEIGGMFIESSTNIQSENENYDLIFNASTFTTNGSYGYIVDISVNGQSNTQSLSVENVSGAGNYTTNGSEITLDGSFVSYEFQGMDFSDFEGEQTAPYTISADGQTLTFVQNTTETSGDEVSTTTSVVVSSSVWTKVENSNNEPCTEASDFAASAENAYNNDDTNTDLCNAYTSALQNQISACGDTSGELQAIIDGLGDCTNGSNNTAYAMTYVINGVYKEVNNTWNTNEASGSTIWAAYPSSDYILLQGGGGFTSQQEVNIWLERSMLVTGTTINIDDTTFEVASHIDYIDNSNNFSEDTLSGTINITFVDPINKIVQGTFEFITNDIGDSIPANEFNFTEGAFNYTYE